MSLQTDLETTLASVIAAINIKIAGGVVPDWSVGSVKFNENSSLETLIKLRDGTIEQLRKIPSESIDTVQNGVGTLGTDSGEYLGEDE